MRPLWSTPYHSCQTQLSNFRQNVRFWEPSEHRKWDVVLQGDTPIASGVFHNLILMWNYDYRSFRLHLQDPYGPHHIISVKNNSQISGKMLDFRYPLSTKYGVWCCKERHPLLLKCFITFLRCIWMAGQASDSICRPIMVHRVSFMSKTNLKFHTKFQIWGTLPAQEMGCCTARRYIYCCWSVS